MLLLLLLSLRVWALFGERCVDGSEGFERGERHKDPHIAWVSASVCTSRRPVIVATTFELDDSINGALADMICWLVGL